MKAIVFVEHEIRSIAGVERVERMEWTMQLKTLELRFD